MIPLPALEEIIDRSGIAPRIELLLPVGVRARQLVARTQLLGMLIVLADHRPAHLTRVHQALVTLPEDDQRRLGVIADWKHGPHRLTYRQTERTFGLVVDALAKDIPDGLPSARLQRLCDDLPGASIPEEFKDASTSLAVDWTDVETFSRPPSRGTSDRADPEASWGHRSGGGPGQDSELFFGYYASAATTMREQLAAEDSLTPVCAAAADLLDGMARSLSTTWHQNRPAVRDLIEQIMTLYESTAACPANRALVLQTVRLRSWAVWFFYEVGDSAAQAILIAEPLLAYRERVLGADHPDTLGTRGNLALAYRAAGRAAEAITLHEQNLADRERVLGATLVSERQRPALRELVHLVEREWQWRQRAAAVGVAGQKRHGADRPGEAAGRVVELPGAAGHVPGELLRPGEQAAVRVDRA